MLLHPGEVPGVGCALAEAGEQDFGVLAHPRMRSVLAGALGATVLADAETASAGSNRTEAVSQARLLLEELRFRVR